MQAWLENRVLPEVTSIGDIKLQLNDPLFKNINLHNAGKTEIEFVQDEEGQNTAMILVDANLLSQLETMTLFIQSTDHKFEGVDNLQLTSISTKHMDYILPLVWIILSDKNEKICESILRKILTLQPTLSPTAIYSEFDSDYWRAVKAVFPNVIIKGMFLSHCKIMINTAKLKNINLTDERTMSILSKIISMSLLPADKIVNSLREFVGSTMTNQDFENLNELMTFYDEKWLTSIDVENYSFYNDSMSLRKNGELILQDMKNRLKKVNALWNLIEEVSSINSQIHFHQDNLAKKGHFNIPSRKVKNIFTGVKNCKCISDAWKEIEAKVLSSIDLIMRTADNLTPILRNLSNSDVKIPIQFQLVNLTTDEENELIDADDELPILNSSDDEPIDDELPILNSSKDEPIDDEIPILYLSEDEPIDDELQILNSSEDEPMDDELPILISSDDEPIDHELPILNLSDDDHIDYEPIDNEPVNDEPIDTLDEEEVQGYIHSQHCLGCYEDSIEIGYRPCTYAPYCWSCNK
ncbi:GSCOCG00012203001-RA-CDS [Cotesia congregata]|nr:GSCOCG00012203001-RA-CDS [Cotesia congregata]